MKIHAFKVEPRGSVDLLALLAHLKGLQLSQRVALIGGTRMKLEDITEAQSGDWRLDFNKIRTSGPGRASDSAPIEDFELNPDQGFGEETAAYFNAATNYMIIQYNHYGPRSSSIDSYLMSFMSQIGGPEGVSLTPVLKRGAREQLDSLQVIRRIEFKCFVPGILDEPQETRQSLNSILSNQVVASSRDISIDISAGRAHGASLAVEGVREMVGDLLGIRAEVKTLRIVGQENENAPSQPIDLLEARLEASIPITLGRNQRYGRPERWAALKQAFDGWRSDGNLPG